MSCSEWNLDISAYLDGSVSCARAEAVKRHLEGCAECASFYAEQHELNEALQAALPDREPPACIWHTIEAQIEPRTDVVSLSKRWDFTGLFRMPRLSYAGAAVVLVLMFSLLIFDTPNTASEDERFLAELEAFSIDVKGNPFLRDVQAENPFFKLSPYESGNPFERLGGSQQ